jgi:NAD(P)-dependent dehydrogenase (short-subunit alcohol dehydrogenase family)
MSTGRSILEREPATAVAPRRVLVAGAGGGIGRALCETIAERFPDAELLRFARRPETLSANAVATRDIACDITDEASIATAVKALGDTTVDWVLVATGWLHDERLRPEKSFRQLDPDHLLQAYRINAVGPALLIKHLAPRLDPDSGARIGVLSARVGSISDNRLGGWHAYRASKAALNMLLKNYALEWSRNRKPHIVVGLQPGTTDTPLSAPFQRSVPDGQLQTPAYTAGQLALVMQQLRLGDSGGLFDFLGLPFDP